MSQTDFFKIDLSSNRDICEQKLTSEFSGINDKITVVTFQSEKVLSLLLENGIYHADTNFSRERQDYSEDIAQLQGFNPIWCFTIPSMKKMHNAEAIQMFRCEMSLVEEDGLSEFMMLELSISKNRLYNGKTHNACSYAKVFSELYIDDLKAVYKLEYDLHWFFPKINLLKKYSEDILFPGGYRCMKTKVSKIISGIVLQSEKGYISENDEFVSDIAQALIFDDAKDAECFATDFADKTGFRDIVIVNLNYSQ